MNKKKKRKLEVNFNFMLLLKEKNTKKTCLIKIAIRKKRKRRKNWREKRRKDVKKSFQTIRTLSHLLTYCPLSFTPINVFEQLRLSLIKQHISIFFCNISTKTIVSSIILWYPWSDGSERKYFASTIIYCLVKEKRRVLSGL